MALDMALAHLKMVMRHLLTNAWSLWMLMLVVPEPGIRCGSEDSSGNEDSSEMKIKNCGKKYFPWGKNQQAYFFV